MRKSLLFTYLLFFAGSLSVYASHFMGGQITSQNIGGLTYRVTFTAYRDTLGITMDPYAFIYYSNPAITFDTSHMVAYQPAANIGNGVEMYEFIDTITFPAAGNYTIWWESCCRNAAILNMANAGGESFYLINTLMVDSLNSSPEFLNIPITVAQLNVPFSYNPLPFDSDGDSIAWVLDIPLSNSGVLVNGFVLPPSDTLAPFNLDPVTGEITFLPNTLGNFVVSFTVNEYRGGVQIGSIRRDMQILVMPSANQPARMMISSGNAPFGGKNYNVSPGTAFNLTLVAEDPDLVSPIMNAAGEPFYLPNPPSFTSSSVNGVTTGTLTWLPATAYARNNPYFIGMRIEDAFGVNTFSNDLTISLRVGNATTGLEQLGNSTAFTAYPNPAANNELTLSFFAESASPVSVEFISLSGQKVKQLENVVKGEGVHQLEIRELNLPAGFYIVRLIQDNKQLSSVKITVQ